LWRAARAAVLRIDQQAAQQRALHADYDKGPLVAFVGGALCLTFMEYTMGNRSLAAFVDTLHWLAPGDLPSYFQLRGSRWFGLADLAFWVFTRALGFVLIPALLVRLVLKQSIVHYGLAHVPTLRDLRSYMALLALVLPCVGIAALQPAFVAYYPFYRHAGDSWIDLLSWELLYAFQFFCVELFFRGFLLESCRKALGSHAILVAVVPYVMVHFTKPLPEVLGAIPAGLVLGLLAMHTRSIWGGVLLHVAVAWTMDFLAIAQTTGFPTTLWPPP
jgi:uncharacterized protein